MHLKIVAVFALVLSLSACGDDGGGSSRDAGPDGSVGAGGRTPRPRPDSGPSVGTGTEGELCDTTSDCDEKLTCVNLGPNAGGTELKICARACMVDADCGTEVCAQGATAEDRLCINVVRDDFGACGPANTAICAEGACVTSAREPLSGICYGLCPLTGTGSDGGADDGGVVGPLPPDVMECTGALECIDGYLTDVTVGVCAERVARGEVCDSDMGQFCRKGDVCAPEDPTLASQVLRCYQDCSDSSVTCDTGTCTDFRGIVAYCF